MNNKKVNLLRASIIPLAMVLIFVVNMMSPIIRNQNFQDNVYADTEETKDTTVAKEETKDTTPPETTITVTPVPTEDPNLEVDTDTLITPSPTAKPKAKINIMKLSEKKMKKLTLAQKAEAVGLSVKTFKNFTSVINHEAGFDMEDKILVAAVIWNRVKCEKFKNSVNGVINEPGQFYNIKKDKSGSWKDKKAQLAILIAYKRLKKNKIPHNLLFFNSISYNTKNKKRYKPYKHYGNYFLKDSYCWCDWCKKTQRKGM